MTTIETLARTLNGVTATRPDGDRLPLTGCDWLLIAGCGCTAGVSIPRSGGGDLVATEESALRLFVNTAAAAKRYVKFGFRCVLVGSQDWRDANLLSMEPCPHAPQWGAETEYLTVAGVPFRRSLDGTEWLTNGARVYRDGTYYYLRQGDEPRVYLGYHRPASGRNPFGFPEARAKAAELITAGGAL